MIISAHQTAYLPWLGYLDKIISSDIFVILDNVQYEKNSFTNRNKIKTPQGSMWITVPVNTKGHTTSTIRDIEINNQIRWREQHWKNIFYNYKNAPYFDRYSDYFFQLYSREWKYLYEISNDILFYLLEELNIKTKIYFQKDIAVEGYKQELIINLCNYFNAEAFIFGTQGQDYVDNELFIVRGITPVFQEYKHPTYTQMWGEFQPYMSVIDLLFNEGSNIAREIIYSNYKK